MNSCYIALDIGTTTLALALVSLEDYSVTKVITATNPQRAFGADVISRIDYSMKNGQQKLHEAIISRINEMILELSKEFNLYRQNYCGCKYSLNNKKTDS